MSFSPVIGEKREEIRRNAISAIVAYKALHPNPRSLSPINQGRLLASCAGAHIFLASLSEDLSERLQDYCAVAQAAAGPLDIDRMIEDPKAAAEPLETDRVAEVPQG